MSFATQTLRPGYGPAWRYDKK